ncbi:MAG: hypothetical protein IPO92_22605 [Saprospiraceae bacterium]|nr:hypothetical protein [Saprospiraceae bacterium]
MLISTVIEGIHHQLFFAQHLPSLTDNTYGDRTVLKFYKELVFNQLKKDK